MKLTRRKLLVWLAAAVGTIIVLGGLYLAVFFLPYPLFPHHAEFAGFSVYSDQSLSMTLAPDFEEARRRVEVMPLYRGSALPRVFLSHSRRRFALLVRLAGKRHAGQGLLISAAGNMFLSLPGIQAVARRHEGLPDKSRVEGSLAAAVAHEVAHSLIFDRFGLRGARRLPAWKSEGYADFSANLAAIKSDVDYDLCRRIDLVLDPDAWSGPVGPVNRRHVRWQVLVEYLSLEKGLDFDALLDPTLTESTAMSDMTAWHERGCGRVKPAEQRRPTSGGSSMRPPPGS